jgi:hypothetical protein
VTEEVNLMIQFPLALLLSDELTSEAKSALPHAPVVPERSSRPAPTRRTRIALANGLQRAAFAVAPAEYSPAR